LYVCITVSEQPPAFVAIILTIKLPGLLYVCVGADPVEVVPSPKSQLTVQPLVPLLVNGTVAGAWQNTFVGEAKSATGVAFAVTIAVCVIVATHPLPLVAVSVTLNVPVVVYVCAGLAIDPVPPSP
jgi:hypothetical protein